MTDYITNTIGVILGLLAGSNTWTSKVRPSNQLAFTTGIRWPEKKSRNAGDYPEFKIEVESSRITKRNAMQTFCNSRGPTGDVVVEQLVNFRIMLTFDSLDVTIPDQMVAEFNAIMLDDPLLGQNFIKESGASSFRDKQISAGTSSGTKRLQREIMFPVTFLLHRSQIAKIG